MRPVKVIISFTYGLLYLILSDFVRPDLVDAGRAFIWWLIVAIYLSPGYIWLIWDANNKITSACWNRSRLTALLLFTTMAILWDPTVQDYLRAFGLTQAWIVPGMALCFWALDGMGYVRRHSGTGRPTLPK